VPNTIFTGDFFTADPVQLFNAELATVHGRFSMSAEYQCLRGTNLYDDFTNGVFSGPRGDATYQALYAEIGYFLTPDYRRYDKAAGTWGRQVVEPECRDGQDRHWRFFTGRTPVQFLCRYTYLDLASGTPVLTPSSGAQAGWENDITTGFDWYINSNVHFIVNYVYTHLEYVNGTSGDINGLGCRLHLDF
jgi:phosphate-selective porin